MLSCRRIKSRKCSLNIYFLKIQYMLLTLFTSIIIEELIRHISMCNIFLVLLECSVIISVLYTNKSKHWSSGMCDRWEIFEGIEPDNRAISRSYSKRYCSKQTYEYYILKYRHFFKQKGDEGGVDNALGKMSYFLKWTFDVWRHVEWCRTTEAAEYKYRI